jgi:hypothetical protein
VSDDWRVASYRFRATFARRRAGLLAVVVMIGLTGGIALGSLAGARRTQSSYPRFLASTNPSDLAVTVFNTSGGSTTDLTAKLAHLSDVVHVGAVDETTHFARRRADGAPDTSTQVAVISSTDGELFDQDRIAVVHGRLADPARSRTSLPRFPDASPRAHQRHCCSKPSSPPHLRRPHAGPSGRRKTV